MLFGFVMFSKKYIAFYGSTSRDEVTSFSKEYEEFIFLSKGKELNRIYFDGSYPMVLFYDPVNPYLLNEIIWESQNPNYIFDRIEGYGKYRFHLPEFVEPLPKTAYIIRNSMLLMKGTDVSGFRVEKGKSYTLLWNE